MVLITYWANLNIYNAPLHCKWNQVQIWWSWAPVLHYCFHLLKQFPIYATSLRDWLLFPANDAGFPFDHVCIVSDLCYVLHEWHLGCVKFIRLCGRPPKIAYFLGLCHWFLDLRTILAFKLFENVFNLVLFPLCLCICFNFWPKSLL